MKYMASHRPTRRTAGADTERIPSVGPAGLAAIHPPAYGIDFVDRTTAAYGDRGNLMSPPGEAASSPAVENRTGMPDPFASVMQRSKKKKKPAQKSRAGTIEGEGKEEELVITAMEIGKQPEEEIIVGKEEEEEGSTEKWDVYTGEWKARDRNQIFDYQIDSQGRTVQVRAFMDRRDLKNGSDVSTTVTHDLEGRKEWRALLDNGGHIVGKQFGGSGSDKRNVVMQDKKQNQDMSTFEDRVVMAIRRYQEARLLWTVAYYDDTSRPSAITLSASFPDGKSEQETFTNPPAGEGKAIELGPPADEPGLKKLVADLYKGADPKSKFKMIGDGSTAAMITYELQTGTLPARKPHSEKGRSYIRALNRWLEDHGKIASKKDVTLAKNLIKDLEIALATKGNQN